eukprot:scaffold125466_cov61-Attheya_sp.AAC.3
MMSKKKAPKEEEMLKEEPVKEEPVVEEPVKEEPVVEETPEAAPAPEEEKKPKKKKKSFFKKKKKAPKEEEPVEETTEEEEPVEEEEEKPILSTKALTEILLASPDVEGRYIVVKDGEEKLTVDLPSGPLGVAFKGKPTFVSKVQDDSPLFGKLKVGYVVESVFIPEEPVAPVPAPVEEKIVEEEPIVEEKKEDDVETRDVKAEDNAEEDAANSSYACCGVFP